MEFDDYEENKSLDNNSNNKRKKRKSRPRSSSTSIKHRNNLKNHHSRGIYHHYTIEYKLQILNIALKNSPNYIEREYGIDHHLLKKWKNDKSLLEAASNKKIV